MPSSGHYLNLLRRRWLGSRVVIAKFHYTDTDTDPHGPNGLERSFAAKKSVSVPVSV